MKNTSLIVGILLTTSLFGMDQTDDSAIWEELLKNPNGSSSLFDDPTDVFYSDLPTLSASSDNDGPTSSSDAPKQPLAPAQPYPGISPRPYIILQMHDNKLVGYVPGSNERFDVRLPPGLAIVSTASLPALSPIHNTPNQQQPSASDAPTEVLPKKKRTRENENDIAYKTAPRLVQNSKQTTFDSMVYCIFLGAGATYNKQNDSLRNRWHVRIDNPKMLNDCINHHSPKKPTTELKARLNTLRSYFPNWNQNCRDSQSFFVTFNRVEDADLPGLKRFREYIIHYETTAKSAQNDFIEQPHKKSRCD